MQQVQAAVLAALPLRPHILADPMLSEVSVVEEDAVGSLW